MKDFFLSGTLPHHCLFQDIRSKSHSARDIFRVFRKIGTPEELAVASGVKAILTFNRNDFKGAEHFGVKILSRKDYWRKSNECNLFSLELFCRCGFIRRTWV